MVMIFSEWRCRNLNLIVFISGHTRESHFAIGSSCVKPVDVTVIALLGKKARRATGTSLHDALQMIGKFDARSSWHGSSI
ncbi:MAG: hypothetical protein A3I66_10170 [Burkholderiales bacterium RIFCSPLOWO2_02_FULL_57_36]|nr:MAG: hypothetical protein A3I66_10170 [Burkholderiales bacterium RIFCSPLOWO2_02_FULL_57_36]